MQLFNIQVIRFTSYEAKVASDCSFFCRRVHSRPLECRSQQLPFDWQQKQVSFKAFPS